MKRNWRKDVEIGIPAIDADHVRLFDLVDRFSEQERQGLDRAALAEILGELSDYARDHFRREEAFQAAVGFHDAANHRTQHAFLLGQIDSLRGRYLDTPEMPGPEATQAVGILLREWLVGHILREDVKMRRYAAELDRVSAHA